MSKVALQGNASGTGTLTVAAPNTNSDYTLTLPAETGTVLTSGGAIDVNASAPADSLVIDSSGNITVKDKIQFGIDAQTNIQAAGTSDVDLIIGADTNIRFETATNERMRIDSSGRVVIGRTSNLDNVFLTIQGNVSNPTLESYQNTTSLCSHFWFRNTNGIVGSITTNGSGTAYNTSSDYRLKENIAPMTGALATVSQLKPCTYTWKVDGSAGQGFIAHELQAVVPDCVTGEKDADREVDVFDEEGNKTGTKMEPVYQGVDTSFLVATLTAAIQELSAKNDALEARIAALEATA